MSNSSSSEEGSGTEEGMPLDASWVEISSVTCSVSVWHVLVLDGNLLIFLVDISTVSYNVDGETMELESGKHTAKFLRRFFNGRMSSRITSSWDRPSGTWWFSSVAVTCGNRNTCDLGIMSECGLVVRLAKKSASRIPLTLSIKKFWAGKINDYWWSPGLFKDWATRV